MNHQEDEDETAINNNDDKEQQQQDEDVTPAAAAAAAPDDDEDYVDDGNDEDDDEDQEASKQQAAQQQSPFPNHNPKKRRRMIAGEKADLYSHFETFNEKAYTKQGRDLGVYMCVCKYCQAAYRQQHAAWTSADAQARGREPTAPTAFPRTKRYCINHQKQCPHLPKENALALLQQQQLLSPNKHARSSGSATFASAATTTHMPAPLLNAQAAADTILPSTFEVYVAKDTFKFNAAHFVAFEGYRERLHGHNYTVAVRLQGSRTYIGPDGYVIDYGNIKKVCRAVCKELNEHFLCPTLSNVLKVTHLPGNGMVRLDCLEDGTYFEFPTTDVKFLPIMHATTEELAIYLWSVVMERLDATYLLQRGIQSMELTVAEAPGQQATFRHAVVAAGGQPLDVRAFIQKGPVVPQPCLDNNKPSAATAASVAKRSSANTKFSAAALQSLTAAMKAQGLLTRNDVTAADLQNLLLSSQPHENGNADDALSV